MHYEFLTHRFIFVRFTPEVFPEDLNNIPSTVLGERNRAMNKELKIPALVVLPF